MSAAAAHSPHRRDRRPAVALGLVLLGLGVWWAAVAMGLRRPADTEPLAATDLLWAGSFWAFLSLGAWIARRRPDNPVGWCLALGPICVGAGVALFEYIDLGWAGAAWFGLAAGPVFELGVVLLFVWTLWYPDGHLPSPGWRWVVRVLAALYGVMVIGQVLTTSPYSEDSPVASPLALGSPVVDAVHSATEGLVLLLALSTFAGLAVRYRRGGARVRAQLKLLIYVVVLVASAAVALTAAARLVGENAIIGAIGLGLNVAALLCVPTVVALAIVRHRAFDIDRTISRTVTYAVITAIAIGLYTGSVLVLGNLARALTGESGDLVVAVSTLLVAGAFQPVRRRVQHAVDRRFNRGHVGGLRAADEFARRLRDQVDLDAVTADLRSTCVRTLQPASASVLTVSAAGMSRRTPDAR